MRCTSGIAKAGRHKKRKCCSPSRHAEGRQSKINLGPDKSVQQVLVCQPVFSYYNGCRDTLLCGVFICLSSPLGLPTPPTSPEPTPLLGLPACMRPGTDEKNAIAQTKIKPPLLLSHPDSHFHFSMWLLQSLAQVDVEQPAVCVLPCGCILQVALLRPLFWIAWLFPPLLSRDPPPGFDS